MLAMQRLGADIPIPVYVEVRTYGRIRLATSFSCAEVAL